MLAVSFVCVYAVVLLPLYTISKIFRQRDFYPHDFQGSYKNRCFFHQYKTPCRYVRVLYIHVCGRFRELISLVQQLRQLLRVAS